MASADIVPVAWDPNKLPDWVRRIAKACNALRDGKLASTGTITLTANAATSTLTDVRVGVESVICFMPTTANAAAEIGAGGMYISARGNGTATITHANNAQTDRTFEYTVTG